MVPLTKIAKRGYWLRVEHRTKMIYRLGTFEFEVPARLQRNNVYSPFEVQENLPLETNLRIIIEDIGMNKNSKRERIDIK